MVNEAAAECRALLFPGEEDFGIAPLEANAAGRPVVAWHGGGATETVLDGETGVFFDEPTAESLAAAIERLERQRLGRRSGCGPTPHGYDRPVFVRRIRSSCTRSRPSPPCAGCWRAMPDLTLPTPSGAARALPTTFLTSMALRFGTVA